MNATDTRVNVQPGRRLEIVAHKPLSRIELGVAQNGADLLAAGLGCEVVIVEGVSRDEIGDDPHAPPSA